MRVIERELLEWGNADKVEEKKEHERFLFFSKLRRREDEGMPVSDEKVKV